MDLRRTGEILPAGAWHPYTQVFCRRFQAESPDVVAFKQQLLPKACAPA
jgi:hypothetical protein